MNRTVVRIKVSRALMAPRASFRFTFQGIPTSLLYSVCGFVSLLLSQNQFTRKLVQIQVAIGIFLVFS